MMGWGNHGYGMGGVGGFVMIIFWVLIIVGVVLVIRYFTTGHTRGRSSPDANDPLQVLRERYARGEIDTEEFEERKKVLEGDK